VELGDDVKLECSCTGCLPMKKPKWEPSKKNRRIKIVNFEDEENNIFTTVLTIQKTTSADEGYYECEISNDLGKDKKRIEFTAQTKPKDVKVTMKGKSLKLVDKVVEIREKETFVLHCIAKAYPIPKIVWFKDGIQISKNQIVLEKENINEHAGFYRCTVTNALGSISKDFNITVKIAPTPNGISEQLIEAKENDKIRLNCDIDGSPEPNVTWSFNYKPLVIASNHKFTNQNKVLELSVQHHSVGTYSCLGKNDFGKALIKFAVFVKGKFMFQFVTKSENVDS
jgi:Immunoglobulin I-set domain/Immunoglobulin domain